MNYTNTTENYDVTYAQAAVIMSLSGIITCMICIYYNIAIYRYNKLTETQKRAHYYTVHELVCNKKNEIIPV